MAKKRRNLAIKLFQKYKIPFVYPQGGIAIFVKIPNSFKRAFDFVQKLLEKEKVSLAPGELFGAKKYFRMNLACSFKDLKEGIEKIAKYYT